jgi:MFS superfamily sulfate permease-like transporter
MNMKTILTLLLLLLSQVIHGQIIHQTINEDKTHEYWFSLDQYQKTLNYAIEIAHLGGNVNRLVGKIKDNHKAGKITIHDTKGKLLFEKKLGTDLSFDFATDQKEVVIAFTVDGFVTYTKKTSVETLSVLVLKLQPESQEEVFQINSMKELDDTELESIMKCVNNCMQHTVNKDISTCAKKGAFTISLQL